jgi:hypothetical protein
MLGLLYRFITMHGQQNIVTFVIVVHCISKELSLTVGVWRQGGEYTILI